MATQSWNDLMQQAEEGGVSFEPLPIGEYMVEIASAEHKMASTGKDMFVVRAKVLVGPYAGKSVFHQFVLTEDNPNALAYFFRHMNALGLDKTFFASNPLPSQVAAALVGRQAKIKVKQREYPKGSGEMKNDVDGWFKADGAAAAPQVQQPGIPQVQAPPVQQQPQPQQPVQHVQATDPAMPPQQPTAMPQPPAQPAQATPPPPPFQV